MRARGGDIQCSGQLYMLGRCHAMQNHLNLLNRRGWDSKGDAARAQRIDDTTRVLAD